MKDLNDDGAKAVAAAMAPWVMKYRVGNPHTHLQDSSNGKKTTEQSLTTKAHIITSVGNTSMSVQALQPPCKRLIAQNSHDCRCPLNARPAALAVSRERL